MLSTAMGMSYGKFVWWQGVIVDIKDPMKAGRVRVRIFGYHDEDESSIKNSELPWSMVGLPTTSAGISGEGESHGLLQGSWVMGFFMDGDSAQIPVVLFSLPGISKKSNTAFSDPDGVYPRYEGEPDTSKLYRGDESAEEYKSKQSTYIDKIDGIDGDVNFVSAPSVTKGYMNKVISRGGNTIEIDGDENDPRISVFHRSGSYIDFLPDGSVTLRVVGNLNLVVDKNIITKSDNNTVSANGINMLASGMTKIHVGDLSTNSTGGTTMAANNLKLSAGANTSIVSNDLSIASDSPAEIKAKYIKFKTAMGDITTDKLISSVKKCDECDCDAIGGGGGGSWK